MLKSTTVSLKIRFACAANIAVSQKQRSERFFEADG